MNKKYFLLLLLLMVSMLRLSAKEKMNFFRADNANLRYMGRVDFSQKAHPKMWASATQVSFTFQGAQCGLILRDENLYGKYFNYINIIVDGKEARLKLSAVSDTIWLEGLKQGVHQVTILKSTEAGIGYLQFDGVLCNKLLPPAKSLSRKIESFGDSITSGMGNDTVAVGCHKAEWYDQTNGYMSYAAITGRALKAQHHLTSVSGIGMIRSCCEMDILMPQVYDKISLRDNKIAWNFKRYQPDVVTVCLGQNDGVQDSVKFCTAYINFVKKLRGYYPKATIVLLSSPMADAVLKAALKNYLLAVRNHFIKGGDKNVYQFIFSKQSIAGCDSHPSISEHEQIAGELTAYIKAIKKW